MKSVKAITAIILLLFVLLASAGAIIRIDITSPERKLPIAISRLAGPGGDEISNIVAADLHYTGIFELIDGRFFIEPSEEPFGRTNWTAIGAEAVLKGRVKTISGDIRATVFLYDAADGTAMLHKEYESSTTLLRQLAHGIANDAYGRLTGKNGVFRSKIAFVASSGHDRELCVMDWDGGRIKRLGVKGAVIPAPRWSPDGRRLIYSAQRDGVWGIYSFDFDSMKEKLVVSSRGTLLAGDFFPDGDRVIYSSSEKGHPSIYIYSTTAGETRKITSSRGIDVSPAVSPDGKKVAFVSDRGGSPQVYTMDGNGYNITRITFEGAYNTSPVWSPSGERIAYVGRHEGKNQIFTILPDGSDSRRLTGEGNNESPSFSPDGRFIAFSSDRRGRKEIFVMRADGSGQRSAGGMAASSPRWSPN